MSNQQPAHRGEDWNFQVMMIAAVLWSLLGVWQIGLVCAVLALAMRSARGGP